MGRPRTKEADAPMTHRDLASLQPAIYAGDASKFDYLSPGSGDRGVVYGIKRCPDFTVVCFRGSANFLDWIKDFWAAADPFDHGKLGPVHPGFYIGMQTAWSQIAAATTGPYIMCGHSLGAAHATLCAALAELAGRKVLERVVWGEPMSGFQPLADLLADIPSTSYRNIVGKHYDRVTSVPFELLVERYVRAGHLTDVTAAPPSNDAWGPLAYHHMGLYLSATPETPCVSAQQAGA
jgi:Lipase (class 3)